MPPDAAKTKMTAEDQKFEAEQDVRTFVRAEEIRKDSKRFDRAMKEARVQMAALKKVKANA